MTQGATMRQRLATQLERLARELEKVAPDPAVLRVRDELYRLADAG